MISSNIRTDQNVLRVNYQGLLTRGYKYFDNSSMMCLNLLRRIGIKEIAIAGFDGFGRQGGNYINDSYQEARHADFYEEENRELKSMLREYMDHKPSDVKVHMITPGLFTDMVNNYDR